MEDILKELDEESVDEDEKEAERRMEELLAGELVSRVLQEVPGGDALSRCLQMM